MITVHDDIAMEGEEEEEGEADTPDDDSGFGDYPHSPSTQSIRSSIFRYREENGRTYHAYRDGKYLFPNDAVENKREDLQHHLFTLTFEGALALCGRGKLFSLVLDAGTGTGTWAIDFAEEHPEAKVIGIDLSPIQPHYVPPNCMFEIDDLEDDWNFSERFDFIHARLLCQSSLDLLRFYRQAFKNLEPGGFLEIQDSTLPLLSDDDTLPQDSALLYWCRCMMEAARRRRRVLPDCRQLMIEAGFEDVTETRYKWATNRWPTGRKDKLIGLWNEVNEADAIPAASMALFTRVLGWTKKEVDSFMIDVMTDLLNTDIHAYWQIIVVYGHKPLL